MPVPSDAQYIQRVLSTLQDNPTGAELDFLVSAFTNIGYLAATAETEAEMAEAQRKFDEATAMSRIRLENATKQVKQTADGVQAQVLVETFESKKAEVKAFERARKLKNLLQSIEQAINAIKFLGRYDSMVNTADRMPGR